jgi:hypothetical protein
LSWRQRLWEWAGLCLVIAVVLLVRFRLEGISEARLQAALARDFPVGAARFIEEEDYAGPIFNAIDWGGYLIWRLPTHQVGIDGRAQLHDDRRVQRFMDTCAGLPGWSENPDLLQARVVLVQRNAPLAALLKLDRRFVAVYEDNLAVVFVPAAAAKR